MPPSRLVLGVHFRATSTLQCYISHGRCAPNGIILYVISMELDDAKQSVLSQSTDRHTSTLAYANHAPNPTAASDLAIRFCP
eukprot:1179655-Prorocentrum_minimum.AAC.2